MDLDPQAKPSTSKDRDYQDRDENSDLRQYYCIVCKLRGQEFYKFNLKKSAVLFQLVGQNQY